MKKHMLLATLGALVLSACENDVLGPGNATEEEEQQLLALVGELPFFADEFGDDGVPTLSVVSLEGAAAAEAPQNWGRRRRPVSRARFVVEVNREAGTATVTKEIEFEGSFLVKDRESDLVVEKDLHELRVQTATFMRLETDEVNHETGNHHRWRLVAISPAEYVMFDEADRSVDIVSVGLYVNGDEIATVTDPAALIDVESRLARFELGAEISVRATVRNATSASDEFNPEATFMYLHLRHASPDLRIWRRIGMEWNPELSAYVAGWVVRHRGRERIVVDAIDADAISLDDSPYLSNQWAVPYRTILLTDATDG